MAYDFTSLAPDDFEALVADLFSKEWGAQLELFKPGKDGGVDLRHSRVPAGEPHVIVQCKRYAPHKLSELQRSVEAEKEKLEDLQPERYVLVTSVSLSPQNKTKLLAILSPWCKSESDIYGADEINSLLRKYPDVVRAHFKLWVSSTAVLEQVLHARIFNVTEATVEATKAELCKLVVHGGFDSALDLLHKQHHVLIVGVPGIGKTTLARMLLCHYLREGFEPVCVTGDIADAWTVVREALAGKRKVVILYDDFLGRVRFESEHFGKNEEISLREFFKAVERSPNLRFILTTREYILADAQKMHGAFDTYAQDILKYTLTLADYAKTHRARMLFNHLYFSDLPDSRLEKLVRARVYSKIIAHAHFNPRVVENVSKHANSRALSDVEYLGFVEREFEDPSKIWEHPFKNDISPLSRLILVTLWSFGGAAELSMLKSATAKINQQIHLDEFSLKFDEAVRHLDGNFISTNRYPGLYGNQQFLVVEFHNPSVEEFIERYLMSDRAWLQRLSAGIVCFQQVDKLLDTAKDGEAHEVAAAFWTNLRMAAIYSEGKRNFNLINYRPYEHKVSRKTWYEESAAKIHQTHTRLRIESKRHTAGAEFNDLQARVTTYEGWLSLLKDITHGNSSVGDLASLQKWVAKSTWAVAEKSASEEALRAAVINVLNNEDEMYRINLSEVRIIAEVVGESLTPITPQLCDAFSVAAKTITKTLADENEDADAIESEAEELGRLEKICGLNMATEKDGLRDHIKSLRDRITDEQDENPEEQRYRSDAVDDFDVDALFSGLLDR